jgi:hypothetical protein
MRIALLIVALVTVAPTPARACEPQPFAPCPDGIGDSIGDDITSGVGEIMLYTLFAGADVAVLLRDALAPAEKARAVAIAEILVGAPQAAVFGYRLFADDERTALDAVFAAGGTLLLARGIYLAARPAEQTPRVLPAVVAGGPAVSVSGRF